MSTLKKLLVITLIFFSTNATAQQLHINPELDKENHDIRLSPWGPYSKKYAGISHIPDMQSGIRFDFTVCPGYYRNKVLIPNVLFESGYSPWAFSADMKQLTYRYQLEWKDQVYTDVTYHTLDSFRVLVEMNCVNQTNIIQNVTLNTLSFIDYPTPYPIYKVIPKDSMRWINAIDYTQMDLVVKTPRYFLSEDGKKRNEVRNDSSLCGSLLGAGFGKQVNDSVRYALDDAITQGEKTLYIRYRVKKGDTAYFQLSGIAQNNIAFAGTGNFEMKKLSFTLHNENFIGLKSIGNTAIELDGFFIDASIHSTTPQIVSQQKANNPLIIKEPNDKKLILKYNDIDNYYGLAWDFPNNDVREVLNDELDVFFKLVSNNNVKNKFIGNEKGHYTNVFFRPIEIAPHSNKKIYVLICAGTGKQVAKELAKFNVKSLVSNISPQAGEMGILPAGKPYLLGNQLLQAALLSNIVYPIYTQRQQIRHFTPGKWWNSLYTWDLGFIALGLQEIDLQKSYEVINAYTTSVGNQSAFIHHGSPVPIQFFAFFDLMNRTQSKDLLAYMYPRLKQYYQFMVGETKTSTMKMSSNLLKSWDYFYNSGGWDDYPPQKYLRDNPSIRPTISPVITTAQCIRAAKIMRLCANQLGYTSDMVGFDEHIEKMSAALQQHAWDDSIGYYSYVVHDAKGKAQTFFRNPADQSNFNKGLDGVSPLIAGIATETQQKKMLANLFSAKHLWTPFGISAVDQSASYYRTDGYWNGTIWMPHQWLMWKSMLDMGEADNAFKIAHTALALWKRETQETYSTFEHFIASSGRGAGWSQFSGLSSPVLNWFAAYYTIGRVTTGFEVWIQQQQFNTTMSAYTATLSFDQSTIPHQRVLLVCLHPGNKYEAYFNQQKLRTQSRYPGFVEIFLPNTNLGGTLKVSTLHTH